MQMFLFTVFDFLDKSKQKNVKDFPSLALVGICNPSSSIIISARALNSSKHACLLMSALYLARSLQEAMWSTCGVVA